MPDVSTEYLGLRLKNPLVPSASPLSRNLDDARRLEDAGAAALVMHSLFEEELATEATQLERLLVDRALSRVGQVGLEPGQTRYRSGLDLYLEHLARLKSALGIPLIASLNGVSAGGWVEQGRLLEQAGADALELNVYYIAADPHQTGPVVEQRYLALLRGLRAAVSLPIAMKLSPCFSSLPSFVGELEAAGADGVVLFNRFLQPDVDLETLTLIDQHVTAGPAERLLAMRWIALLHGRVGLDLAGSGGVFTWEDAAKMLLSGANVVHLAGALLRHGPGRLGEVLQGLSDWMERGGHACLADIRGRLSAAHGAGLAAGLSTDPSVLARESYMMMLDGYSAPGM